VTYLVGLHLAGKRVLVAGAGSVGTRRAVAMAHDGAHVVVVAPDADGAIQAAASRSEMTWLQRTVTRDDIDGAWFVVAATDSPTVNADLVQWCEEAGVWSVNASDVSRSAARVAAQSRHGDLALGVISLGDADPRRAVQVRDALAMRLDEGDIDTRHRRARDGRVVLVGSGPGADDLITVRGMRVLAEADVVIADRLAATGLLDRLPPDVEIIDVGKSRDNHPVPQDQINALLVDRARAGKSVVRLKGGDPFVFGRGGEEVHACLEAGISVEVVPGVSSALGLPTLARIPVTQRGVSSTVVITSGHAGPDAAVTAAMVAGATVVALMAVSHLDEIVSAGLKAGASPETPVAIVENGSTPRERITRATLARISLIADETGVKPPAVIVIGEVARPGLLASEVARTARP